MAQVQDSGGVKGFFAGLRLTGMVVGALFLAVVLYSLYIGFSKAGKEGELALIQSETAQMQEELQTLETAQVGHLTVAKKALVRLDEKFIKWSEVLTLLLDATPDDIAYRSYSGNENGSLTMAAVASSFARVADLIGILEKKSFVKNVFVPSVVKGTSPTNAAVYSFSLNVEYEQ